MDIRYPILDTLYSARLYMEYTDLLNALAPGGKDGVGVSSLLRQLHKDGFISGEFRAYHSIHLEPSGVHLYLQLREDMREAEAEAEAVRLKESERLKDAAKQMAQQRAQKKKDRAFDFLKLALGGVITLLVEHIDQIIALLS